ncbi:hypothetical protein DY000_02055728 [Brassica cretica]|uniref:Uncharacterized protein n=1 Tax=Brassica cretica TaxID=69181 RepID=A0ABQ7AFS4_BRACR|nr:hypothetical protein DY000_02055728 [Brassica cretica]
MIFLVKKVQFRRFQKPATLQAGYFGALDHQLLKPCKFTSQPSRSQACRSEENYTWRVNDTSLESFSTKHTWEVLHQRAPLQLWAPNVWSKGAIPRHAFLTASAMHVTKSSKADETSKTEEDKEAEELGFEEDVDEKSEKETARDDTDCPQMSGPALYGIYVSGFRTWNALSNWQSFSDSSSSLKLLKRLVCQGAACCVRSKRNKLLHYNISTPPGTIFKLLDRFIRDAVLSKWNKQSSGLMQHWLAND